MSTPEREEPPAPASFAGIDTLERIARETIPQDDAPLWSDEDLQSAFARIITMYARKFDAGHRIAPYVDPAVNATAVLITASMMLKTANVEVFELGMWQSFSGIK